MNYSGQHYQIHDAQFLPTPLQQPRIPIWTAGFWPTKKPFQRAARWDGVCPLNHSGEPMSPEDIREMLTYIQQFRTSEQPFDVVASGQEEEHRSPEGSRSTHALC